MASATGIAFSRDGRNLLIHSDRSGVFNVYALPIAGGEPVQISQSTTNATFAATYFPDDDRVLFTADQGGNELDHRLCPPDRRHGARSDAGASSKADSMGWSADGRPSSSRQRARGPGLRLYAYDTTTLRSGG